MIAVTRGPRWHIDSAADGDTHWAAADQNDIVRAPCGATFRSVPFWRGQPPGMDELPDAAQGCPVCVAVHARTPVEAAS